jgi:prepilin peptidase CpaA
VLFDLKYQRIPNWLTLLAAAGGLLLQSWLYGMAGFGDGFLGLMLSFIVLLPFYASGWFAAGDVKLLMAIGACLGWRSGLMAVMATLLVGAGLALIFLLTRGDLRRYLRRYWLMAKNLLVDGRLVYIPPGTEEAAAVRLPYALAIALGTMIALNRPGLSPFS